MAKNENIERFESLLSSVQRDGIEKLIAFVKKSDFYIAPASTKFHLAEEGGLLAHSLHVYDCLVAKRENPIFKEVLKDIPEESFIISALLHDICKTYYYSQEEKNQKTYDAEKVANANPRSVKSDSKGNFIWETVMAYTVDDKFPYGHGEKSVMMIEAYIRLKAPERYAIRWHMGAYSGQQDWNTLGKAYDMYPFALALHEADMEATHILEVENG